MATSGGEDDAAASRIHKEIIRLKRELVRDDLHGHSCEKCKHIKLNRIPDFSTCDDEPNEPVFRLEATPDEICNIAKSGCIFWLMLRDWLAQAVQDDELWFAKNPPGETRLRWEKEQYKRLTDSLNRGGGTEYLDHTPSEAKQTTSSYDKSWIHVVNRGLVLIIAKYIFWASEVSLEVTLVLPTTGLDTESSKCRKLDTHEIELHILSLPESWRTGLATPINVDPGSSRSMELYRHWLKQCDVVHECGISDLPSLMPSFVLNVTDSNTVKLFQVPAAMKERYVALSYCWGVDRQTVMLTRSNKPHLLAGVAVDHLDPTIRDSVTVARELGFRFLWVDALCILQDDAQWKARELEKMGDIYRNATLSIVVSGAKDVTRGFLHCRTPTVNRRQPVFKFHTEETSEEGADNTIILVPATRKADNGITEPWYQRAWTMQEMLFSRRRLQFRLHQATWICHCNDATVREYDGWISGLARPYYNPDFDPVRSLVRSENVSTRANAVLWNWLSLVSEYSARQIRYHSDRLPAISAIAREFAARLESDYACGLWMSYLPMCLLWYHRIPGDLSDRKSGPSWSWASHDFEVEWSEGGRNGWRCNQDFKVLGSTIDLTSPGDPFGAVKRAELHVRGLLIPASVTEKSGQYLVHLPRHDGYVFDRFDYVNYLGDQKDPSRETSLLVLIHDTATVAKGIIVLEEDNNKYSRVGVFWMHNIWPRALESKEHYEEGMTEDEVQKSQEKFRDRLLFIAGGEESIREFVLI